MATLTHNDGTGEYESFIEVTINGSGISTGLLALEPETGGQFKLGQNFPNPYELGTSIPFTLANASDVTMELFDVSGRKVALLHNNNMPAGEHAMLIDTAELGIEPGNDVYQISVKNQHGLFQQCKMMTARK